MDLKSLIKISGNAKEEIREIKIRYLTVLFFLLISVTEYR